MDTALAPKSQEGMSRMKNYIMSPEVKERFAELMGPDGIYYLNQVMILVANSTGLQQCDPKSILISALRAASLKLNVDPSSGQAWIIPYKGRATFQLGYRGVYELAQRTGLYRFINVIDIYEGEKLIENRMTGNHTIGGKRSSDKVIAYMLYFQLVNGFEKTFVMTVKEIEEHARRYSAAYQSQSSKWNDPHERPKMERKTVLMNGLRRWGRFNANDVNTIDQIESDQGWIDRTLPEEGEVSHEEPEHHSVGQILSDLGFGTDVVDAESVTEAQALEAEPLRYQPEELKTRIADLATKSPKAKAGNEQRGLVCVCLEQALSSGGDAKANRKQLLHWLTGKSSMTEIDDPTASALYRWLEPSKDSGGAWSASLMATREAIAAFNAAQPKQDGLPF